MKKISIILLMMLEVLNCYSQAHKKRFPFPDTDTYKVLKCDFHQHTIFSDGLVWPKTRVTEAWDEDLDVIALTDHIEYRPFLKHFTSNDYNQAWELAKEAAKTYNILLIKSAEITRGMPPGHLNLIGIKDANAFDKYFNKQKSRDSTNVYAALSEAKRQGAFIIWNHTAYPSPDNQSTWYPIHELLKNSHLMNGIEVVNGERYESKAFKWCMDFNLAPFGNTDVHTTMAQKRNFDHSKTMTLVLAKDKTQNAVMEALFAGRTVAIWKDNMYGKKTNVESIVKSALEFNFLKNNGNKGILEINNKCGQPLNFEIVEVNGGINFRKDVPIFCPGQETVGIEASITQNKNPMVRIKFLNVYTQPNENLETEFLIIIK